MIRLCPLSKIDDWKKDGSTGTRPLALGASADKRDAEYKVAIEKCDALVGPAKDACVGNAKAQYGKL